MSFTRKAIASAILLTLLAVLSMRTPTRAQAPAPTFANFEEAQTNPVRLSADGTLLFAVNTPNASLSVFDVTTPGSPTLVSVIPVGLGPVSVNPRTDDEVWVVNQVSNSVSIVSVSQGIVTATIPVKAEPMDVVFAGSNAYISVSRFNAIAVIDATTYALVSILPVYGGSPRALAVSPDGSKVYAAFAIAGNATTIIPSAEAPVQCGVKGQTTFTGSQCVPAFNPALPTPPQVGLIVSATDPTWSSDIKYKMPANGVVAINATATPSIAGYYSNVGTINLGLAVNPVSGDLYVANTAALNTTNFEPNQNGHFVNNQITSIQVASGTVTPFNLNPNIDYGTLPNPAALSTALAQPAGVVVDPGGSFMYVAAFGTDRVAQVTTNGAVNWFVELNPLSVGSAASSVTKRGPRGLALNAAAQTLYSLNRISDTISVINTSTQAVSTEIPVGDDPTPTLLKAGRGFLYDAKLSGNGTGSCSSCHVDGDMDHLAWNLGNPAGSMTSVVQAGQTITFHPMKGPMTTQTFRGLLNLSPYHWRGEIANFVDLNPDFSQLLGGTPLSTGNMDTYALFASNILFLPNPNENLDRTLPTSFAGGNPVNGETDFMTILGTGTTTMKGTCNQCHTSNPGPGSNREIQTTIPQPVNPQPFKVPQLRNVYQKELFTPGTGQTIDGFGLSPDGNFPGLAAFLSSPLFAGYTAQQITDIIAYSLCFDTGTAPAVGFTITVTAPTLTATSSYWTTLQSQATAGNVDLIGRGTIQGVLSGLLYQPQAGNYISNLGTVYTQAQLQGFITAGDTLSFMGVYPGTGSASTQP